jgi:hypothetical protein
MMMYGGWFHIECGPPAYVCFFLVHQSLRRSQHSISMMFNKCH